MAKYLITGAKGMLGYAVCNNTYFQDRTAYDVEDFDLCNIDQMRKVLKKDKPTYLINCAAYTDVTKAESDYETAYEVNALGVKNLCILSKEFNFKLIQISTDFIFKGDKEVSRREGDIIDPVNAYGKSKAEGEKFITELLSDYMIIRISWLYGPNGNNFVSSISKLMQKNKELTIVSDQFGRTTYSIDAAEAIAGLIKQNYKGIIHYANQGVSSRFEFTKEIYKILKEKNKFNCNISPILAKDYPDQTPRPTYSVLNTDKLEGMRGKKIRDWKEALREYLNYK